MTSTPSTIEGMPAWATRRETNGDGSGSWWERDLTKRATAGTIDGTLAGIARLVLCDGVTYVADELTGEEFASPADMRTLSAHLFNAAAAWQEIRDVETRCEMAGNLARLMDQRGVDVAGLADRLEIDAQHIEALLDMSEYFSTTEVALFCHVFDVDPSQLLPARLSA